MSSSFDLWYKDVWCKGQKAATYQEVCKLSFFVGEMLEKGSCTFAGLRQLFNNIDTWVLLAILKDLEEMKIIESRCGWDSLTDSTEYRIRR